MVFKILFITVFSALSLSAGANEIAPLNSLLSYFGPGCTLYGANTQSVAASANALASLLLDIKNDPDCKSLYGSLIQLQGAAELAQAPNSADEIAIQGYTQQKAGILTEMNSTQDPTQLATLASQLQNVNLNLAQSQGFESPDALNQKQAQRVEAAQSLLSTTQSVMQQLQASSACWEKRPDILAQVGAFGTAVGQSGTLGVASGGITTAVGAGLSLSASIVDYIHQSIQQKRINKMIETVEPTAITCAVQSIANQWCQADDAIQALTFLGTHSVVATSDPSWQGIRLLERELPSLRSWIETVRSGYDATSSAGNVDKQRVKQEEANLYDSRQFALGYIGDNKPGMKANSVDGLPATTLANHWIIEKDVIKQITANIFTINATSSAINSPPVQSPLAVVYNSDAAPWILFGVKFEDIPRDPNTHLATFKPLRN